MSSPLHLHSHHAQRNTSSLHINGWHLFVGCVFWCTCAFSYIPYVVDQFLYNCGPSFHAISSSSFYLPIVRKFTVVGFRDDELTRACVTKLSLTVHKYKHLIRWFGSLVVQSCGHIVRVCVYRIHVRPHLSSFIYQSICFFPRLAPICRCYI